TAIAIGVRMPVSFRVGPNGTPGRLGDLVEAPGAEPVSLQFSEGSSILVGASSRVRVLAVESVGAQVLVGSATAALALTPANAHPPTSPSPIATDPRRTGASRRARSTWS